MEDGNKFRQDLNSIFLLVFFVPFVVQFFAIGTCDGVRK
jgi:hypothetical protein